MTERSSGPTGESSLADAFEEAPASAPKLGEFILYGIGRSRYWIVILAFLGAVVGAAVAFMQPNYFVSSARILVRLGARESTTPEGSMGEEFETRGANPDVVDELLLLTDPDLVRRVVDDVGAATVLKPYDPADEDGRGTPSYIRWIHRLQLWWFQSSSPAAGPNFDPESPGAVEAAVQALSASTEIANSFRSNVLTISCQAASPATARVITRAYVKACQEKHREVFAAERHREFIAGLLEGTRSSAALAEEAFAEHKKTCGIADLAVQKESTIEAIHTMRAALEEEAIGVAVARAELEVVEEQLATTPATVEESLRPQPVQNPRYTQLLSALESLNVDLEEVKARFVEGSEEYVKQTTRLVERIAKAEDDLRETPAYVQIGDSGVMLVPSPVHAQLITRRAELMQQQQRHSLSLEMRREALQASEALLERITECEPVHTQFEAEIAHLREQADRQITARDRAQILELIDRDEQMSNLIVVSDADLPLEKAGPKRGKIVGIGLLFGLALGLGVAILRHLLDRTFRYPERVEQLLGVRVLGVVPEHRKWRRRSMRMRMRAPTGA